MFAAKHAACTCALAALVISSVVHADPDLLPVCTSDAIAAAHRSATKAVVIVRAPNAHGMTVSGIGFMFGSMRNVATAFSLVENGRGIEVEVGDDTSEAEVIAFSRTYDLAILRLERPYPIAPLHAARGALSVGEPVLVLGRTDEASDADIIVTSGMITSSKMHHLRSDALDGPQIDWGGPVLDCSGELVGVATQEGARIAPAAALDDLMNSADPHAEPYQSGWSILHPSFTFHGQIGAKPSPGFDRPDGWLGFGFGTALIGNDRWYIPFEARALMLVGPESPDPLVRRSGTRLQLATGFGYRFLLSSETPIYLIPTVGAVLDYDTIVTRTTRLSLAPGCRPPAPCSLTASADDSVVSQLRLMPTAGVKLQVGIATVGYEFALDVEAPERSTHQLSAGLHF